VPSVLLLAIEGKTPNMEKTKCNPAVLNRDENFPSEIDVEASNG
jgi:hypothetical protein